MVKVHYASLDLERICDCDCYEETRECFPRCEGIDEDIPAKYLEFNDEDIEDVVKRYMDRVMEILGKIGYEVRRKWQQ